MPIDNTKYVQDNYMRPDEIDARDAARLMAILDEWEDGKYQDIWHLLHDVYEIIVSVNPLHWQDFQHNNPHERSLLAQGYIKSERERFAPYIKPMFLDNPNSNDIRSSLEKFKRRLEDAEGTFTSFDIAVLIFDSVSVDGDGGKTPEAFGKLSPAIQKNFGEWHLWAKAQPNPFHGDIASLKVKAAQLKNPQQKVDLFHFDGPEPEEAFRKRLEPHIAEMRIWCKEQGITERII